MPVVVTDPVHAWNEKVLIASESTFGTTPNPAGSQGIAVESLDMGPVEQGDVQPLKDKTAGRGMQAGWVEGRVVPVPFSMSLSQKSRAANTTVPVEGPLYVAGGLVQTVGGSSVTYSQSSNPTVSALSVYSVNGDTPDTTFAEQGYGGVVKTLEWTLGERELMLAVSGQFAGKEHLGYSSSATLVDASDLSLALTTAADAYRMGLGWYSIENEHVLVTAWDYTTGIGTVTRGQLSSSAAAHSAVAVRPYVPTMAIPSGTPIRNADITVTLDGAAVRATKVVIRCETGIDHLPHESGSRRVQGIKVTRYNWSATVDLVLTAGEAAWLGKVRQRKSIAVTIATGTGAGGIATWSFPTAEAAPFPIPKPHNDISIVSMPLRVRDNAGSDSASLVLT